MNSSLKAILLSLTLCWLTACKKNTDQPPSTVVYEETLADVKKNEPVLLTFGNNDNGAKVSWTITPAAGTTVNAIGNTATITFTAAGTYSVVAATGNATARYTVLVVNTDYNPYEKGFALSTSKLIGINRNEPVEFSVHNASAGSSITWSVYSTAYNINVNTGNQTASITFTDGNVGVVTATDGVNTQSRTVWINDPANADPTKDTVPFVLGEQLQLKPSIVTIGGSKQLTIEATTTNNYHCPGDKILSFSLNGVYEISYGAVVMSKQACSPAAKATAVNSFSNVAVGTHDFSINVENKTYTGTLTVSADGTYTFNWPDTSAVRIAPLSVK